MDRKTIETIEALLKKGYRVELIPVKDGVRIYRVDRKEVNKSPAPKS